MSGIDRFFVREATVTHPVAAAGYGDGTILDYENGTTETVMGWLHQLSESEQQDATRDAAITTQVFRCPAGSNITVDDRLTIGGTLFDVDGPPSANWTPAGEHHMRVSLRYSEG